MYYEFHHLSGAEIDNRATGDPLESYQTVKREQSQFSKECQQTSHCSFAGKSDHGSVKVKCDLGVGRLTTPELVRKNVRHERAKLITIVHNWNLNLFKVGLALRTCTELRSAT